MSADPILRKGIEFDQAHSRKLEKLWDDPSPEARKECRAFAMFCAGITDSVFHKVKLDSPKMVEGQIGFGIPRGGL
jgi:hypothetical protein